jgi:hypothetical protein
MNEKNKIIVNVPLVERLMSVFFMMFYVSLVV